MDYNISFSEMNELARQANSKKPKLSLDQMRQQVLQLKKDSNSKVKKQPENPYRHP
ncbi:hypothetical protein SAMN05192574_108145 [Mucilaginibacter gossypiicola]|uniref:Uncharacterized protein n=1 Tax=Mucilaginibacter gossypiicola TaxID=551995 RepID=A0A1H8PUY7_9SPHI|nr:hypothetical protein [Mucilaginibacter gossypiicola]SEO45487.1 hypothetical protein SAMN05192574_108145 [Mucilaginibacter gossypiicola]